MAYVVDKLGSSGSNLNAEETAQIEKIGGRMIDLELVCLNDCCNDSNLGPDLFPQLVYKVRSGLTVKEAVDDIITRSVIELRKAAFGDDTDDAKTLPWSRPQAWKLVSQLAEKTEVSSRNCGVCP
jgi:hypothetical protein